MTVHSEPRAVGGGTGAVERDPGDAAGLLLGRLTALPVLVLLPFMLTSFPLLLVGYFKPVPVIVLWLALTALIVPYLWRRIPSVTGAADWGTTRPGRAKPTPRWVLWSLVAVSVAFGIFNAAYHSQFVIDEYDAASYMQFANWISQHGTTIIAENSQFFGGHPASITFASAAFFQVDGHVVPQFMAGLPMVLSLGFWAGGMRLALFWAPVLGALGVFTFGGLVARLVGPRWAPFAALALGVTIPMQYVSRDTWSEPLALIFLVGGLSLWIDSQRTDRGEEDAGRWRTSWRHHSRSASHVLAGIAGLLLGLVFLIRVDGSADILLVVPYCGLLVLRGQRQVVPFMAGLLVGTLYGAVDGIFLSLPYLRINSQSVIGEWAVIILVLIATVAAVRWLRRRGSELRPPPRPWLVRAVTILPVAVLALGLIRPYVERGWAANYTQDYAAVSLHWIYWYTGAATIALAVIAYALLGRRCIKGEAPVWVLPILVFACATCIFLLRPAITPHQPMASRRLVPAVLPGVILVAVWMAAWLARKSRAAYLVDVPAYLKRTPQVAVIAVCAAGIALPPLTGNLDGLAFKRTFAGEVAAVNKICEGIPKGRSVLIIDAQMMLKFGQAIRGTCNVPVAAAQTTIPGGFQADVGNIIEPATIIAAVRAIEDSGHQPFVLAADPAEFTALNEQFGSGTVTLVMDQTTNDDEHIFIGAPKNTVAETFTVYSWEPGR
ncbi:MAG TPA: hypothetical protein VHT26_07800 [Trebonia sp.]|nr:hypothetical protein [Trebonia sp.]